MSAMTLYSDMAAMTHAQPAGEKVQPVVQLAPQPSCYWAQLELLEPPKAPFGSSPRTIPVILQAYHACDLAWGW